MADVVVAHEQEADIKMARITLDLKGLACPLPVLRANKEIKKAAPGDELICQVTDPAAPGDFANFCDSADHQLVSCTDGGDFTTIVVRKHG